MKKSVFIIVLGLLAFSCRNGADMYPEFITGDVVRLEVDGKQVLSFDPLTCQSAHNVENTEFRVLEDDASDYFIVRLEVLPSKVGDCTPATVEWTSTKSYNKKNITLRCVRIEDDVIWLWGDGAVGVVLSLL